MLKFKFYALVSYYMIGIFMHGYYIKMIKQKKDMNDFTEADFEKLFQFEYDNKS